MGRAQRKARAARAAPHSLAEPFTAEPCSRTVPPSAADRSAARTGCVRFLFWSCSALLFVVRGEVRRRYGEPPFPCSSRSLRGKHRRQVAPDLLFFFCYLQGNTGRAAESPERRCASIGSMADAWGRAMTARVDFTNQAFFRDPAGGIESLRALGPVVATRFPIVGKVWITTTYESTARGFVDDPACDPARPWSACCWRAR